MGSSHPGLSLTGSSEPCRCTRMCPASLLVPGLMQNRALCFSSSAAERNTILQSPQIRSLSIWYQSCSLSRVRVKKGRDGSSKGCKTYPVCPWLLYELLAFMFVGNHASVFVVEPWGSSPEQASHYLCLFSNILYERVRSAVRSGCFRTKLKPQL